MTRRSIKISQPKWYTHLALLSLLLIIIGCTDAEKEEVGTTITEIALMVNLSTLGVGALVCSLIYKNRKKNNEILKVIAIVLLIAFGFITFRLLTKYPYDLFDHYALLLMFLICGLVIGISIFQLIKGSRRKDFSPNMSNGKPKVNPLDKDITEDQEIY